MSAKMAAKINKIRYTDMEVVNCLNQLLSETLLYEAKEIGV